MARSSDAPSRLEILVLSSLARIPMHGYEIMLELQYKHVGWWAKCEPGHLYAVLLRLEDRGYIRRIQGDERDARRRRIYKLTPKGLRRVRAALRTIGAASDSTYFDADLFLSGVFLFKRKAAVEILEKRRTLMRAQLESAQALRRGMGSNVPLAGRLIIDHRIDHLTREVEFARRASGALRTEAAWGPFLGKERIDRFLERAKVPIESAKRRSRRSRRSRRKQRARRARSDPR